MNIYTSYYANARKLKENDIVMISISLGTPKWIKEFLHKMTELAPNYTFLKKEQDEYKIEYIKKLKKYHWADIEKQLELMSKGKDVALCCYESLKTEDDWCHRTMLAEYVNEMLGKEKITEWSDGKPKKTHFVQLSLL